jgi:methyl-accepting chemotaxis protein
MVKPINYVSLWQERIGGFWGRSIRRQLLISFGLVTLLVMISFSYLMYMQQRDFLYRTDADRAKGLASALASSSTSLVLTNDVAGLQEVLLGFSDAPDLKFALVLSPHGEVLGATNERLIGRYINDKVSKRLLSTAPEFTVLIDDAYMVDVAMPIIVSERHIGWARVEMSRNSSNANLKLLEWTGTGFSLLSVMASVIVAALLAWHLTRKFYHLKAVMDAVESGNRELRFTVARSDEVGKLAQSFNRMLDTLNQSELQLGRINRLYAAWTESSEVIVRQKDELLLLNSICQILAKRVPFELVWVGVPGEDGWVCPVACSGI